MNQEFYSEDIGEHLGIESVETAVAKVEAYCEYERQRIALTNQPKILALQYEGSLLQDEERDLIERLRRAPPPTDLRSRRRRASYYWGITTILAIAGFVFALVRVVQPLRDFGDDVSCHVRRNALTLGLR